MSVHSRERFREFYQADIDIIGDGELSVMNDAEVPSIMYHVFTGLGLQDFTIRLNNRKVLNGLFELYGQSEHATDVMRIIDKLEKIGAENVRAELAELQVSAEAADELLALLGFKGSNEEILEKLRAFAGRSEKLDLGVQELSGGCLLYGQIRGSGDELPDRSDDRTRSGLLIPVPYMRRRSTVIRRSAASAAAGATTIWLSFTQRKSFRVWVCRSD